LRSTRNKATFNGLISKSLRLSRSSGLCSQPAKILGSLGTNYSGSSGSTALSACDRYSIGLKSALHFWDNPMLNHMSWRNFPPSSGFHLRARCARPQQPSSTKLLRLSWEEAEGLAGRGHFALLAGLPEPAAPIPDRGGNVVYKIY
jgi:hypothetical protein